MQERSRRKQSGGRYKRVIIKKKMKNVGGTFTGTILGERKTQTSRTRNANAKTRLSFAKKVNIYDPKSKKYSREDIKTILENPANAQFVRRNIITKGVIVETSKGKVKITSRPGQQGSLSGILV